MVQHGFVPARHWGQNFLIDKVILRRICGLAEIGPGQDVFEIGPGPGALTITLAEQGALVYAVDIDPRVDEILRSLSARFPGQLTWQVADLLATSWERLWPRFAEDPPLHIVGNLPYYITAPLLVHLIEDPLRWESAVVMVQREVADRLLSPPGTRDTSTLSVLMRYQTQIEAGFNVPPSAFVPEPEVHSAVIKLIKVSPLPVAYAHFRWAVRAGFQHRRKMLRQSLARAEGSPWDRVGWDRELEAVGIDPTLRAEALVLPQWVAVAQLVERRKSSK